MTHSLDYQRRLVKNYYSAFAALYQQGMLPPLVHQLWGSSHTRIIPDILVPMDERLRGILGISDPSRVLEHMNALHESMLKYEQRSQRGLGLGGFRKRQL